MAFIGIFCRILNVFDVSQVYRKDARLNDIVLPWAVKLLSQTIKFPYFFLITFDWCQTLLKFRFLNLAFFNFVRSQTLSEKARLVDDRLIDGRFS